MNEHLTPFGCWLYSFRLRMERLRDCPVGWRVMCRGRPVVECKATPYDDTMPVLPFLVCYWSIRLKVFGVTLLHWHRQTKLRRYKHRRFSAVPKPHHSYWAGRRQDDPRDWGLA